MNAAPNSCAIKVPAGLSVMPKKVATATGISTKPIPKMASMIALAAIQ